MARRTLTEKRGLYAGLQKGVRSRWKKHDPVWAEGVAYSMQEIDDILQRLLDAIRAVQLAEAALHGAVSTRDALERKYRGLVNSIVHDAQTAYGNDVAALAAFSLKPAGVPGPKKLEVKVASAQKGRETRARRGRGTKAR